MNKGLASAQSLQATPGRRPQTKGMLLFSGLRPRALLARAPVLLPAIVRRGAHSVAAATPPAAAAANGNGDGTTKQQPKKQQQVKQQQQQQQGGKKKGGKKADGAGGGPYSATVTTPVTPFSLRANAVVREPEIQQHWAEARVYETLSQENSGEPFTLHDGPPYANGDLHMGHALNKVLKDIIVRYKLLTGRRARFVPGWDTHGLPIELKVLQSLPADQRAALDTLGLRAAARRFALETIEAQKQQFRRYGVWGDWATPYVTLAAEYEAAQLSVFGAMYLNGHIYRGKKPVHWSPSSRTALAEAELEYPEGHTSRSIYVALPITAPSADLPAEAAALLSPASPGGAPAAAFAVWTTTPWTIPANLAVAVNGDLDYAIVQAEGDAAAGWAHQRLVVAAALAEPLAAKLGVTFKVLATLKGSALAGCTYTHPLYDRTSPCVVGGDYITTESGTGLVHTAPGHGQEDYQVGLRHGLPLLSPVDDAGCFTEEAGPAFAGLSVQSDGNAAVIDALAGARVLLLEERYAHKYPYDWRTKKPTIFRATSQWFASVEGFRNDALAAIDGVTWLPAVGRNRITAMTQGRSDWCISRQRKWGVPIPVFYHKDSGEPLLTEETLAHVTSLVEKSGSDVWWTADVSELLPPSLAHLAPDLVKGEDTMDVWFDSGSSWAGVLRARAGEGLTFPADLYLEGSDQHRGWFQSSLLTAVAATGGAPYKSVLTHGFVLDERGNKMSKSLGNVVDPRNIIEGGKDAATAPPYGADVLRLWVASVDYSTDVMIGSGILKQVAESYRKLRGTLRFLLGNLSDYDESSDAVAYEQLPAVDRWLLWRLSAVMTDVTESYESYNFRRVFQSLLTFVSGDLSSTYLDASKDRMYIQARDSPSRRACQTVQHAVLRCLLSALAPLVPHMAEDAWLSLPAAIAGGTSKGGSSAATAPCASVFLAGWSAPDAAWATGLSAGDAACWDALPAVRESLAKTLEAARAEHGLGASLEAAVSLHVSRPELAAWLSKLDAAGNGADELRSLFIVSDVSLAPSADAAVAGALAAATYDTGDEGAGVVTVGVRRAQGAKCARCWSYSEAVGTASASHPALCERCVPVVEGMGFVLPGADATATVGAEGAKVAAAAAAK